MFGFNPIWFIGVVEDRTDPLKIGRCKVRCLGFHQQNMKELPIEHLPWAQLLIPPNSQNEIKPPKEGSWVIGFFKDGVKCQEPMVISLIPGIPTISSEDSKEDYGFYDKGTDKDKRPFPPKELKYSVDGKKLQIEEGEPDFYPPKEEGYLKQSIDEPDTPRVSRNDVGELKDKEGKTTKEFRNDKTELPKNTHIDKVKEWRIGGDNYEKEGITKALSEQIVGENSAYSKTDKIDRTSENASERKVDGKFIDGDDGKVWKEKETAYKTVYPYNKTEQTESGHVFEVDDTKGAERIHQQHRSGTFYEIHPDGSKVEKVMADNFHITQQNEYKLNLGNYEVTIKKNKGERVEGDIFIHINGERSLKIDSNSHVEILGNDTYTTKGNREQTTVGNKDETVKGNRTENVEGNHTETITKNQSETVKENKDETVKGNRTENVEGNHTETITKNQSETVKENKDETVLKNRTEVVHKEHLATIGGNSTERVAKNSSNLAKGSNTIQGLPINLALSSASFSDFPGGGSGSGIVQLGIGSTVNSSDGSMSGGKIVKVQPDNTANANKLTFDFANLNEIVFQNFSTIKFLGNVEVGNSPQPVGIRGSVSSFSGSSDVHSNHRLSSGLSQSLKASKGGSSGNTRGG